MPHPQDRRDLRVGLQPHMFRSVADSVFVVNEVLPEKGLTTKKGFHRFDDTVLVLQSSFLSKMLERLTEYFFRGTSKCKNRDHTPP